MIDPSNIIYTRLKIAVSKLCSNTGTTNSDSPPVFPYLYCCVEDNSSTAEDLENNENAVISVIKLESYSKASVSEAKKIMVVADAEMRRMGYRRVFGAQEVTNAPDTKIKRVVARYQRTMCSNLL